MEKWNSVTYTLPMCTDTRHTFSTRNLLFIIILSNHHNLTFSQHFSSTEIWSHDPWFARPVSYRCAMAAFPLNLLKYGALAALAWVLTNPWNFNEGFLNPWILNRLLSNCNKTSRLKYESILWIYLGNRKNEKHFATFLLCDHLYSLLSFGTPLIWNPNAATEHKGYFTKIRISR